ncbi:MAG: hypothetical protein AB4426_33575 [Xenococcaceae cyanobacterium]
MSTRKSSQLETPHQHSSLQSVIWVGLFIVFFLFCWRYAGQITLWGDEAFSLIQTTQPWFLMQDIVHLPTYQWILKAITSVVGDGDEVLLRSLHVFPFIVGLGFGISTVQRVFKDHRITILTGVLAIALPNYIFYATNLRMYSLLFMTEMAFIDAVSRAIVSKRSPSNLTLIWIVVSGLALICTDYAGVIYYVPGVFFLGVRAVLFRRIRPFLASLIPSVFLLVIALNSIQNIREIAQWNIAESQGLSWTGIGDAVKWLYLAFRPALDIIYSAGLPLLVALALPCLWLLLVFFVSLQLFIRSPHRIEERDWILFVALLWLPLIPSGYNFTRLFLPSQLFMIAVVVWGLFYLNGYLKGLVLAILVAIGIVNLTQLVQPTLRLYNLIPYRLIAEDIVEFSEQYNVTQILLSDNSHNTLSVQRYLQSMQSARGLKVHRLPQTRAQIASAVDSQPFLFVSHMDESGQFVNIPKLYPTQSQLLSGYIKLENLPYNRFWKQRLLNRSSQPYAVQLYWVNPSGQPSQDLTFHGFSESPIK